MNILITGGTGFVGSALSTHLLAAGHHVTILGSRRAPQTEHPRLAFIRADTTRPGAWQDEVARQDALINLAGVSVFSLWTKKRKEAIYNSRILSTKNLVDALPETGNSVLISASAAGFYGNGGETELHEQDESKADTHDFLAQVCRDWEAEAKKATTKGARVALARFGVVLDASGGALQTMKPLFQLGLGGPMGGGQQWFPWIHLDDLIAALVFLLSTANCQGPFNCVAPQQVRQKEFATAQGKALHRPAIIPVPAFALRLALGEFGASLLQGQRIMPKALLDSGFHFAHPQLDEALSEIFASTHVVVS